MRPLSESTIIRELAERVCRRISQRVIRSLQGMTDTQLSGEDSGLKNVWEEVCVQVQLQPSLFWDAYEQTVTSLVAGELGKLAPFEREAVWLQSPEGVDWNCADEAEREPSPVLDSQAVDYIVREFVYGEAGQWSNPQIRQYLGRACSSD